MSVKEVIKACLRKLQVKGCDINADAKYIMKITGYEDYLIDHNRHLVNYENVLLALRGFNRDSTIVKLSIVKITDQQCDALIKRIEYDDSHMNENAHSTVFTFDYEDTSLSRKLDSGSKSPSSGGSNEYVSTTDLSNEVTFRVRVRGLSKLRIPEGITDIFVKVGLYYSDELLHDDKDNEIELSTAFPYFSYKRSDVSTVGDIKPQYVRASEDPR
jgi:hypothetical protein